MYVLCREQQQQFSSVQFSISCCKQIWYDDHLHRMCKKITEVGQEIVFLPISLILSWIHILPYNVKTGRNISLADLQLTLIRKIIQKYHKVKLPARNGQPSSRDRPLWLSEKHLPSLVPPTENKKNAARYYHVFSNTVVAEKNRRKSRYMCAKCNMGLYVQPCFEKCHTVLKILGKWHSGLQIGSR
jgi:hypothetical protein